MGFLDHIFSPDPAAAAQSRKDVENIGRDAVPVSSGSQFLHPKPPPSRLAPALRVSRQSSVVPPVSPKPNLNPSPAASLADQPQPRELVLTVGDILPHLPTEAIKPGLHDADALVRFDIGDLSADIARGRATILLSKLADLCPELVHKPEAELTDLAIRLPLQKLVEQLSTVKAVQEPTPLEAKPEDLPEDAASTAPPEPPLVQLHGDIVGHAASPVWLDPIKKNRPEPRARTMPRSRSRRDELKPTLPPTPLAKTFAKRRNIAPASTEPAVTSGIDESVTVMDPEQQSVSTTTPPAEDLAIEVSSTPVEMEAVDPEAVPSDLETPEHIAPRFQDQVAGFPPADQIEESAPLPMEAVDPEAVPPLETPEHIAPQFQDEVAVLPPADQIEESAPQLEVVADEPTAVRDSNIPGEISEQCVTYSEVDETPVEPEATVADNTGVSEPAPLANDSATAVTEASSDAHPAPEISTSDSPGGESPQSPTTANSETSLPPTTLKNDTVPMIPTPPRIRPPAPPPPVLATPAAGLREAISQSPTGESSSTSPTAHAQGSTGDYRARITWPPASPQTEGAKPRSGTNSAAEAGRDGAQTNGVAPGVSGIPGTHTSTSSSEEAPHGVESLPPGGSVGVRPPPIQLPSNTLNTTGTDLSSADTVSSEPARDPDSDSAASIPVLTPSAKPQSVAPLQPPPVPPELDEQRSGNLAEPLEQTPVKSSPPISLVAARPTAPIAVSSSSMPSHALALFNQENLQALFMTEELLDVSSLARHVAALPGITACALFAGNEAAQAGEFPPDFDLEVLREMGVQFVSSANVFGGRLLGRDVENVTLQGGGFSVTLFARAGLCLCVVHRARGFLPGVREKLAAVADELAKGA